MWPVVTLNRTYRIDRTFGEMILPSGQLIHTLEPPWLNNRRNVSCIPPGFYFCRFLERSASGKYKRVWHVEDVPGRGGILIHAGNYLRHTLGCQLPGMSKDNNAVYMSRSAMAKMRRELKNFYLQVV